MNSMIQTGDFSSVSDVVNTSVVFFLGKISEEKTNSNFDFSNIVEAIPADKSAKTKVVVALNGYSNSELEKLVAVTHKNKSLIVRIALFRFFELYNNTEKTVTNDTNTDSEENLPEEKLLVSESELETIVLRMVTNILKNKQS